MSARTSDSRARRVPPSGGCAIHEVTAIRWACLRGVLLASLVVFLASGTALANVLVNNPDVPQRIQNAPSITLDPATGLLISAYADASGANGIGTAWAPIGGVWTLSAAPPPSVQGVEIHASIASDAAGNVYAGMASYDALPWAAVPNTLSGIYVSRSQDGGNTFPLTTLVSFQPTQLPLEIMPKIEADDFLGSPYFQRVYVTWERDLPPAAPPAGFSDIRFAYSTDMGVTWPAGQQQNVNDNAGDRGLFPDAAVGSDGSVVVAWLDSPYWLQWQGRIMVDRSIDGGQTFGGDVPAVTFWTVPGIMTDVGGFMTHWTSSYPSVEIDPSNPQRIGITYAADPDNGPAAETRLDVGDTPPGSADAVLRHELQPGHSISCNRATPNHVYAVWADNRSAIYDIYFHGAPIDAQGIANWPGVDINLCVPPPNPHSSSQNQDLVSTGNNVYVAWDTWAGVDYVYLIYFNGSNDNGQTWLGARNLDFQTQGWAYEPSISGDGNNVCAVWRVGTSPTAADLYCNYSSDGGATWQNPEIPVHTGGWVLSHDTVQLGTTVYLVWQEGYFATASSEIFFSRSTDGGATWSVPVRIDTAPGTTVAYEPRICCGTGGQVYVAWTDNRVNSTDNPYFRYSHDFGMSWLPPAQDFRVNTGMAAGMSRDYRTDIACDEWNVAVIYESDRNNLGGPEDIYINCSVNGGVSWLTPDERMDTGDLMARGHSCCPRAAVWDYWYDPNQHPRVYFYATWQDNRNDPAAGATFDVYSSWITWDPAPPPPNPMWQPPQSDVRIDVGTQPGTSRSWDPHIACDWTGPYYVSGDERNSAVGNRDIFANQIRTGHDEGDIFYIESTNGGQTWTNPLRVNDDPVGAPIDQSHPWLDFKPNGIVDVAWYDKRNDQPVDFMLDVWFASLLPGAGAFNPNVQITTAPFAPPTGTGGWIGEYIWLDVDQTDAHIVWTDSRTDPVNGDIFYALQPNPQLPGACCMPGGACFHVTASTCAGMGGDFLGEGIPCDPNPCIEAVCCVGEDCHILREDVCVDMAGEWHPEWQSCEPNPCATEEAVCCVGSDCYIVTEQVCRDLDGVYYAGELSCDPNPCGGDYADHNVGMCILTVTDAGILGFTDGTQTQGSGFIYPVERQGENRLFLGGLWVGLDPGYIANRDYDADPAREWTVAIEPDGHIWIDYDGYSDQDMTAFYTDSAAVVPKGLFVQQESWAFAYTGNEVMDDFVILRYFVENQSDVSMDEVYVGVFLDIDIADYSQNVGWADPTLNLVYMADAVAPSEAYVGLRLLQDAAGWPPLSNVSLIHNGTYVYPNSYILDADKHGFLSASAPQYTVGDTSGLGAADYGVIAAAGPLSLPPGGEQLVAFAIVGGESPDHLVQNAHVAQLVHEKGKQDAPGDEQVTPMSTRLLRSRPNPFGQSMIVRFELAQEQQVTVGVFDVTGRRVRTLTAGEMPRGSHTVSWDGRDESGHAVVSGIYFLRLQTDSVRQTRRIVVAR